MNIELQCLRQEVSVAVMECYGSSTLFWYRRGEFKKGPGGALAPY